MPYRRHEGDCPMASLDAREYVKGCDCGLWEVYAEYEEAREAAGLPLLEDDNNAR